jgi:hypothetical protein
MEAIRKSCGGVDFAKTVSWRFPFSRGYGIETEAALHLRGFCYRSSGIAMMKNWSILLYLLLGAGCSSKLETGYQPRPLDMPIAQRETLYADPYSQHAMQAQQDQPSGEGGSEFHRPGTP